MSINISIPVPYAVPYAAPLISINVKTVRVKNNIFTAKSFAYIL